ncbi:MAG: hypothetical protein ACYTEW_22635 [Planctomycetota bacterium]|jgi:hypothetical protein
MLVNLSLEQEKRLVKIFIGGLVLLVLGGLAYGAVNRGLVGEDNCGESYPVPHPDHLWEVIQILFEFDTNLVEMRFMELDEDGRIAMHVVMRDGTVAHFTIMQVCQDEEGYLYPVMEFGVIE